MIKNKHLVVLFLLLSSCAHSVHQVQSSDFSFSENAVDARAVHIEMGKMIQSKKEQFVILGFTGQTDYVNQAYQDLMSQCSGPITGLTTQLSSSLNFFSWTNKVLIQGLCLKD